MEKTLPISAVTVVDHLLSQARDLGASDLHLDPVPTGIRATLRRDGVLQPLNDLPPVDGQHVVGRLKALADLLAYRRDIPQEGRIPADRAGLGSEVRVATFPTINGERVALRFESPLGGPQELSTLGLTGNAIRGLNRALLQPEGVILLTGPSGSGKTTTLYSCLHQLVQQETRRSIITIEDPVERRIEGITQTEINRPAGLDFTQALRSILRQDPDVILVGEIRDPETAAIALEAGLTGHLVASTVHAGTAPQVFSRLLELGVEPFVITTAVRGVLSQRLLRRRCCDHGCDKCGGTGYSGRVLLAQWLPMDGALRGAILNRQDGEALTRAAEESGMPSLAKLAAALVDKGITTKEEAYRVIGNR